MHLRSSLEGWIPSSGIPSGPIWAGRHRSLRSRNQPRWVPGPPRPTGIGVNCSMAVLLRVDPEDPQRTNGSVRSGHISSFRRYDRNDLDLMSDITRLQRSLPESALASTSQRRCRDLLRRSRLRKTLLNIRQASDRLRLRVSLGTIGYQLLQHMTTHRCIAKPRGNIRLEPWDRLLSLKRRRVQKHRQARAELVQKFA